MKKTISFILTIIFLISCKSNKYIDVEIKRDYKNFNLLIYKFEDSTEVIIPFAFKIVNNGNKELELNPIKPKRKVTFLSEQHTLNKNNELETFFFERIKCKDSLTVIVYGSKKIRNNDLEYPLVKEKSLTDYRKRVITEDYQDVMFKKTDLFRNIVKNIEKDSIFFEFTNQDQNIHFYKVGTLEGSGFFTDDKSK